MEQSILPPDTRHFRKAYTHGRGGIEPPSVFGPDDEWKSFYREMRERASYDAEAARWARRAKRILEDRGATLSAD